MSLQIADQIWHNGMICVPNGEHMQIITGGVAVRNKKIVAVGPEDMLKAKFGRSNWSNLQGKFLYPGFCDPHAHLLYLGQAAFKADLRGASSPDQVVTSVKSFADNHPELTWITGRGWNQELWNDGTYSDWVELLREQLDATFPEKPVYLTRIDGHAALANGAALAAAGISRTVQMEGGEVECKNGIPTGLLVDAAMDLAAKFIPAESESDIERAFIQAEKQCVSKGLTAVTDCGLSKRYYDSLEQLQHAGQMKLRVHGMLTPDNETSAWFRKNGPFHSELLHLRCFKYYADGALGSRGARMLEDYSDAPGQKGIWMHTPEYLQNQAEMNRVDGFQMSVHAIGDAAVRRVLDTFAQAAPGPEDRWRMEHAQIIHPNDLKRFESTNTVPSVQTCHAVSDRSWVMDRIGSRVHQAYRAETLRQQCGWLVNGSDFPIEPENPLRNFYTAVFRREPGDTAPSFQPEEKMSRSDALRSMTEWAAKIEFAEKERGKIEVGKCADFTILDTDLLHASEKEVAAAKVHATVINGETVFEL